MSSPIFYMKKGADVIALAGARAFLEALTAPVAAPAHFLVPPGRL